MDWMKINLIGGSVHSVDIVLQLNQIELRMIHPMTTATAINPRNIYGNNCPEGQKSMDIKCEWNYNKIDLMTMWMIMAMIAIILMMILENEPNDGIYVRM